MKTAVITKHITPEHVESLIKYEDYEEWPGSKTTICVLKLLNGTTVVGVNYGAVDEARHSSALGQCEARKQAIDKVFELEGYLLRQRLFEQSNDANDIEA